MSHLSIVELCASHFDIRVPPIAGEMMLSHPVEEHCPDISGLLRVVLKGTDLLDFGAHEYHSLV